MIDVVQLARAHSHRIVGPAFRQDCPLGKHFADRQIQPRSLPAGVKYDDRRFRLQLPCIRHDVVGGPQELERPSPQ